MIKQALGSVPVTVRGSGPSFRLLLLATPCAGIVLGALGRASDYGPVVVRAAFNLGVPWLAAAFVVGVLVRREAAGAGAGSMLTLTAMVAYYAILVFVEGRGGDGYAVAMASSWGAVGAVGGALFGWAGALITGPRLLPRAAAVALLAGAFMGEAAWLLASDAPLLVPRVVLLELVLGASLPLALVRSPRVLAAGVALSLCFGAAGIVLAQEVRDAVRTQGWRGH